MTVAPVIAQRGAALGGNAGWYRGSNTRPGFAGGGLFLLMEV